VHNRKPSYRYGSWQCNEDNQLASSVRRHARRRRSSRTRQLGRVLRVNEAARRLRPCRVVSCRPSAAAAEGGDDDAALAR